MLKGKKSELNEDYREIKLPPSTPHYAPTHKHNAMRHFHNVQKSRVDRSSVLPFAHPSLLLSLGARFASNFRGKETNTSSHVPWKIVASFTRAVLKLILIFLAFTPRSPSPRPYLLTRPDPSSFCSRIRRIEARFFQFSTETGSRWNELTTRDSRPSKRGRRKLREEGGGVRERKSRGTRTTPLARADGLIRIRKTCANERETLRRSVVGSDKAGYKSSWDD